MKYRILKCTQKNGRIFYRLEAFGYSDFRKIGPRYDTEKEARKEIEIWEGNQVIKKEYIPVN
jgi:hypothetical protein